MKNIILLTILISALSSDVCSQTFTLFKNEEDNSLQALAIDEINDRIWVGTNATTTGNTFAFLENNEWTIINAPEKGLIPGRATDIAIYGDKVAMSTYGGVSFIDWDNQVFETFTSANSSLKVDAVHSLAYDSQTERLYAANGNGYGVHYYDDKGWSEEYKDADFLEHLVFDDVNDILYGGGVRSDIIQLKNEIVTNIDLSVFTYCTGLALDTDNNLWIASEFGKGIFKYDGTTLVNFNSTNSDIPAGDIKGIAVTTDGYIWFVAANNLYRFDEMNITLYDPFETDLPTGNIRQMKSDKSGNLWLASAVGLIKVSPSTSSVTELDTQINIFPNPCSHNLIIDQTTQISKVKIIDMNGKVIMYSNETILDISALHNGVYIVEMTTIYNETSSERIIKI